MPRFRFKAVTAEGAMVAGEIEALSADAAIAAIQARGEFPLSAVDVASGLSRRFGLPARRTGASQRAISIALRELATLLEAGLPLDRALDVVRALGADKRLDQALVAARDRVRSGAGLADALAAEALFPKLVLSLIRAGELAGALDEALRRAAEYQERAHLLTESIKSALIYPVILVATAGLSITFILTSVLPQFKPMFAEAGQALPLPTQIVMFAGDLVSSYGWVILLVLGAGIVGFRRALKRRAFRRIWDRNLLRMPVIGGLALKTEIARFSRTLGTLLASGLPLPNALLATRDVLGNQAMADAVEAMVRDLRAGEGLSELLRRIKLFPGLVIQLVKVGEESGKLEDMLLRQAEIYDREVSRTIERLMAALVPGLTIGLGLIVAGIIASILLAILKVNELAF